MLIFFLATTTIDIDKGIGLALPGNETKNVKPETILYLLINAQGKIMLDEKLIELYQIKDTIKQKLLENSNIIVSIKTDPETEYSAYIAVLDQLKQARLSRISISTQN